ncbi:alpha/beta hydrolase fold domain-containing protein [Eubacterium oxidoreducens]|uniref:Alpha/beta hydrolase fold n=1 Tax=Eubacterium oxidoreducens TaxID=1732 RepID=A0A1G6AVA9_EUBOX|nr:alpha/beta hydrolase fold domain-containing protein [Eubacterium oxidoreducens]SDB12203.1 alpha/beta hydrolase fold [Eubacterium oxidoreducens]
MKNTKLWKSVLPAALSVAMVCTGAAPVLATTGQEDDALSISDATTNDLTVSLDSQSLNVKEYIDAYVANPTDVCGTGTNWDGVDQAVDIYVPENATEDSAVLLCVNNAGWQADAWSGRTVQMTNSSEYVSTNDSDIIGAALKRGMIIVSYGCRSRNDNPDSDGNYISHAPATMTDTKAVIRYLRANAEEIGAGDMDKIVVTGTSGGGALTTIIASSGNSSDYYESLYEIGAAGIEKTSDGEYVSTIGDDVFGAIAYCPINDLREADAAYEWTYGSTRQTMISEGTAEFQNAFTESYTAEDMMKASSALADQYSDYVDGLGLALDDGTPLTSDNLEDAIVGLLEDEITESIEEVGSEQMTTDSTAAPTRANTTSQYTSGSDNWTPWLTINEDGSYDFDYDQYLYWIGRNVKLKVACAFSNKGLGIAQQNEDSLYGSTSVAYSPYEFYSWNNDATLGNGVGLDDTGLSFDRYLKTKAGKTLAAQLRMTTPISYLTDDSGSDAGESAKYWYVRHGMADRDTSFALQTILRYALTNDDSIEDVNFEFAWLKPHSGNYDVQEAMTWLDASIAEADAPTSIEGAEVTLAKDSYTYDGKKKTPNVVVTLADGTVLDEDDYDVTYTKNTNVGTATVTITGKGDYTGTVTATFKITKAKQTIKHSSKTSYTYSRSKVSKAKQTIKIGASAKGKVTYSVSYPTGKKGNVTVKNGKIVIKKNAAAGTYKVKVKAAATTNYKAATVTIKIKIKK